MNRIADTINPRLAANDLALVCDALRSALVRYEKLAWESGYDLAFINNVTEADYALLNRCQLEGEVTK